MTKKQSAPDLQDTEVSSISETAETPETTLAALAAYEAGMAAQREITKQLLIPNSLDLAESYCKAFFNATVDKDNVCWLSLEMQGQPAHITTQLSRMFRNSRKFNVSQIAPYRVTVKGF